MSARAGHQRRENDAPVTAPSELTAERDEWMRRAGPFYPGLVALCALTVVPWPRGLQPHADDLVRAGKWFPAVGAALGLALAVLCEVLLWMEFTPALVALILVGSGIVATGPGWLRGAVTTTEWASRGGTSPVGDGVSIAGVLTIIGLLALRAGALLAMTTDNWGVSLFLAEVLAHWCIALLLHVGRESKPVEQGDYPWLAVGAISFSALGFASAIAGAATIFTLITDGAVALLSLVLVTLAAFGLGALLRHRFGRLSSASLATIAWVCGLLVLLAFSVADPAAVSPWVR